MERLVLLSHWGGWGTYRRALIVSAILLLRRIPLLGRIAAIAVYYDSESALLLMAAHE